MHNSKFSKISALRKGSGMSFPFLYLGNLNFFFCFRFVGIFIMASICYNKTVTVI